MRQAMRESALMAPPLHDVGARVAVAFQNHTKLFAGSVTGCRPQSSGRPIYDVNFDDGEAHTNLPEEQLRPARSLEAEMPVAARRPSDEQKTSASSASSRLWTTNTTEAAREQARPPTPNLPEEIQPGGKLHCGGDLCFPNMTLAHQPDADRYRMPLFMMRPLAVALFSGCDSCHCTTEHHDRSERRPGCEAHVSFAVQTPASVLGMGGRADDRQRLHHELLELGTTDVREQWSDAVWVPVYHFKGFPAPPVRLKYSEKHMYVLPWPRVVLYDVELGRDHPRSMLVAYDVEGGLSAETASDARKQFNFLANEWSFKLDRHSAESERSGCLHLDAQGWQRMEMLGIHDRRRNLHQPCDRRRPGVAVVHPEGDLDAYVVHLDHPEQFGSDAVKPIFNAISARLHALLPSASSRLAAALEHERVRERLYTGTTASGFISDDLIVNNVGVSSEYQSPPHFDVGDVGWTAAFSGARLLSFPGSRGARSFILIGCPFCTVKLALAPFGHSLMQRRGSIPVHAGKCGECGECPSTMSTCVDQQPSASLVPCMLGAAGCNLSENHTSLCTCKTSSPRARERPSQMHAHMQRREASDDDASRHGRNGDEQDESAASVPPAKRHHPADMFIQQWQDVPERKEDGRPRNLLIHPYTAAERAAHGRIGGEQDESAESAESAASVPPAKRRHPADMFIQQWQDVPQRKEDGRPRPRNLLIHPYTAAERAAMNL